MNCESRSNHFRRTKCIACNISHRPISSFICAFFLWNLSDQLSFSLNISNDKTLRTKLINVHKTSSIFEPLSSTTNSPNNIVPSSSSLSRFGDQTIVATKFRNSFLKNRKSKSKQKKCNRCDAILNVEDSESIEYDEAIFAMIGNLWSLGLISDSVISQFYFPSNSM